MAECNQLTSLPFKGLRSSWGRFQWNRLY